METEAGGKGIRSASRPHEDGDRKILEFDFFDWGEMERRV